MGKPDSFESGFWFLASECVAPFNGTDLTHKSDDEKSAIDLAMEVGHEKAMLLLGEGITKRFRHRLN